MDQLEEKPEREEEEIEERDEDKKACKEFTRAIKKLEFVASEKKFQEDRRQAVETVHRLLQKIPDLLERPRDAMGRSLVHQTMLRLSNFQEGLGIVLKLLFLPVILETTSTEEDTHNNDNTPPQPPPTDDNEPTNEDSKKRKVPPPKGAKQPKSKRRRSSKGWSFDWTNPRGQLFLLQDNEGKTPLMIASYAEWDHGVDYSEKIRYIFDQMGVPLGLTIVDKRGWTVFEHSPSLFQDQDGFSDTTCGFVLEFPVREFDFEKRMQIAARTVSHFHGWSLEGMLNLIERVDKDDPRIDWRNCLDQGRTLLHYVVDFFPPSDTEDCDYSVLLDLLAILYSKNLSDDTAASLADEEDGLTPLHYAALGSARLMEIVNMAFHSRDLKVRAVAGDEKKDGRTPLHIACEEGNDEVAEWLIKEDDSCLGIRDDWGNLPLDVVQEAGFEEFPVASAASDDADNLQ